MQSSRLWWCLPIILHLKISFKAILFIQFTRKFFLRNIQFRNNQLQELTLNNVWSLFIYFVLIIKVNLRGEVECRCLWLTFESTSAKEYIYWEFRLSLQQFVYIIIQKRYGKHIFPISGPILRKLTRDIYDYCEKHT